MVNLFKWMDNSFRATTDPSSHLKTLTEEQLTHLHNQQALWMYYEGNYQDWLAPKQLPNGAQIDDNVRIKLARRIVHKGNNFLFGKGLEWQLNNQGDTTKETILDTVWGNQERQNTFLSELGINGAVAGTFYIQIISKDNQPLKLKNLNPLWVFPTPDSDTEDAASLYDVRWFTDKKVYRLIHDRVSDIAWSFRKEVWNGKSFEQASEVEIWNRPYPFILEGKNLPKPNSYFGCSDLEDIDINDTINQVSSNLNRIIRIFAHPVIHGYGFGSGLSLDSSKIISATDPQSKLEALELSRDLASPMEYLKYLRSILSEITNVPESDPERLKIGASSGFALEVLFNDLVLKTGIKRNFYGKALIELNRRLLDLMGQGDNNQTILHWPNPLPVDKLAETESDRFDLEAGLGSKETLATKRGYDWVVEKERIQKEKTSNNQLGEAIVTAMSQGSFNNQNNL